MTTVCRYAGEYGHVCGDRDGRSPPRDVCWREAGAQLNDLRVLDLLEPVEAEAAS